MMLSIRIVANSRFRLCFCHVSSLFTFSFEEMILIVSLAGKRIKCSPFRLEYRQAFTLP